jgi:hypothetical protein
MIDEAGGAAGSSSCAIQYRVIIPFLLPLTAGAAT